MAEPGHTQPTIPELEAPPRVPRPPAPPAARAYSWARCPRCRGHERVALVLTPTHLVYREHTYRTWNDAAMTCSASGVAVCVLPPREGGLPCVHPVVRAPEG